MFMTLSKIDPSSVPQATLASGASMPMIGLGTFGSDHAKPTVIAEMVLTAAAMGYRHFDCASVYGNELEIGAALADIQRGGIPRDDLWITSKVWNDKHRPPDVVASCKQSLTDLRLEHLDLYLVHWPFPNFHPPGCDANARNPNATAYIHERYMETWGAMENLLERGLVRHIGTSNMSVPKLQLVLHDAHIKPAANEMELHPHFQQPELFQFVRAKGIQPIGYSPLGSPNRPERDRTPEDTSPLSDPVIASIGSAHGVHPAEVCIRWAIQRGQVPIPFSTNPRNCLSNLHAATSLRLTDEEMSLIGGSDKKCRLIKGHVFLWKEGQSWEALWDEDGQITPP